MKVKPLFLVLFLCVAIIPLSAQLDQTNPPRHITFRSQSNVVDINASLKIDLDGSRLFNYDIKVNSRLGVIYFRMPGSTVNIATFNYRLQCYVDRIGPGFNNNRVQLTQLFRTISLSNLDMDRWYSQALIDNRNAAMDSRIEVDNDPDDPYAYSDVIEVDDDPDDPYANRDVIEVDDAPDRPVYGFTKPLYIDLNGFVLIIDDAYYCDAADGSGKALHLQACLAKIDSRAKNIDMAKDDAFVLMALGRDLRDRQVPLRLKTSRIIWDSFLPNELPNPDFSWIGTVDKDVAYSDAYREDPNTLSCRVVFPAYFEFKVVEQLERLFVNQEKQKGDFILDNININPESRGPYKRSYPYIFNTPEFKFTINSIQRVPEKPHIIKMSINIENTSSVQSSFYLKKMPFTMIANIDDGKSIVSEKIASTLEWGDGQRSYRERTFQIGEQQDAEFYFEAPNRMPITEMQELVIEHQAKSFVINLIPFILR